MYLASFSGMFPSRSSSSEIINIFKCKEKFNEYRINLRNKISNYEWRNVKSKWIEALTEAVNHY